MDKQTNLHARLEAIWWITTLVLVLVIFFPIYNSLGKLDYPFWVSNTVFIVVFVTFARYIFLMKHTWLAYQQWAKVVLAVLCIPLFMYLQDEFQHFRVIADEIGLEEIFDHLSVEEQASMSNYVRGEMFFFGAGSIICSVLMPFRLLKSFWRTHNKGTV